jgi:hypothetical protein
MEDINYSNFDIETFIKILETQSSVDNNQTNSIKVTNNLLFYFEKELNFNYLMFTNLEKEIHEAKEHSKAGETSPKNAIKKNEKLKSSLKNEKLISNNKINETLNNTTHNRMLPKGKRKTSFQKSILSNSRQNFPDFLQNERHNFMMGDCDEEGDTLIFKKKNALLHDCNLMNMRSNIKQMMYSKNNLEKMKQEGTSIEKNKVKDSNSFLPGKFNFTFTSEQQHKLKETLLKKSKKSNDGKFPKNNKKISILKSNLKNKNDHNQLPQRYSSFSKKSVNSLLTKNSIFDFSKKKSILDTQSLRNPSVLNHTMLELEITDPNILIIDEVFEFNHFSCNNDYRNIHINNSEALIKGNDSNIGEFFSGSRRAKTKDQWFGRKADLLTLRC